MRRVRTISWGSLEQLDAPLFFAAGGLLLATTAINGLDAFTSIETQAGLFLTIEGASGFGGVVLFFVGLMALYPRLSDISPRLARSGLWLSLGPGVFFAGLLVVCSGLATLLALPSLKTLIPSFGLITAILLASFVIALTLFGVCSMRTSDSMEIIGGLLLVTAAAWFGLFGAIVVYRYQTPTWVTFVQTALMAGAMAGIGFRLRMIGEVDRQRGVVRGADYVMTSDEISFHPE